MNILFCYPRLQKSLIAPLLYWSYFCTTRLTRSDVSFQESVFSDRIIESVG